MNSQCRPWWCRTKLPRPGCRISAPLGRVVRCSAASNNHPSIDNNSLSVDTGTGRRIKRCCIPSTSCTAKESTRMDILVRSGFGKAPNVGAYPPVRRACSQPRWLCSRCRRCFSRDDASCCLLSVVAVIEAGAVNCCGRCSCTGLPNFRYPTRRRAMLFRFWVVNRTLDSTIPAERRLTELQVEIYEGSELWVCV